MTITNTSAMYRLRVRRVKRTLAACLAFLLLCCAGYAGYALANSSFFDLAEITVQGNNIVSRDEIIAISGMRIGANLLRFSRAQATANILSLPYIKDAEVSRTFPNRVGVRVSERTPAALVFDGEQYMALDESGRCLTVSDRITAENAALPVIHSSEEASWLVPGEQVQDKGVLAALALIESLDPFFLENIVSFDAPSAEKLAVINRDGLTVYFGFPEDLDRKLQNYEELLIKNAEKCNAETLEYVDLRYDTQITLKWKQ